MVGSTDVSVADAKHSDPGALLVTGTLEAHGATVLCSEKATFSAKAVVIERTAGGGIAYQFAITVTEPTPAVAEVSPTPPTAEEKVLDYFSKAGKTGEEAKALITELGADSVWAAVEKKIKAEAEAKLTAVLG